MDKILQAWPLRDIQEYLNIRATLKEYGKTDEDVKAYLKDVRESKPHKQVIKKCPECGKNMNYSLVAEASEKYNEGYRMYWLCGASCCPGKGCGYEEFSTKTIEQILEEV